MQLKICALNTASQSLLRLKPEERVGIAGICEAFEPLMDRNVELLYIPIYCGFVHKSNREIIYLHLFTGLPDAKAIPGDWHRAQPLSGYESLVLPG
jgi:hypothetical protein